LSVTKLVALKPWASELGRLLGRVKPSMVTASVMGGSPAARWMTLTMFDGGMSKRTRSGPGEALASAMAWRNEPTPASAVMETVNVAAEATDSPPPTTSMDQMRVITGILAVKIRLIAAISDTKDKAAGRSGPNPALASAKAGVFGAHPVVTLP